MVHTMAVMEVDPISPTVWFDSNSHLFRFYFCCDIENNVQSCLMESRTKCNVLRVKAAHLNMTYKYPSDITSLSLLKKLLTHSNIQAFDAGVPPDAINLSFLTKTEDRFHSISDFLSEQLGQCNFGVFVSGENETTIRNSRRVYCSSNIGYSPGRKDDDVSGQLASVFEYD